MPAVAAKTKWRVPFRKDTHEMLGWVEPSRTPGHKHYIYGTSHVTDLDWYDNFEFNDTMQFSHFECGRSAVHIIFWSKKDERKYQMFLTDFERIVPKLENGVINGSFTFCKRGQNYGVMLTK